MIERMLFTNAFLIVLTPLLLHLEHSEALDRFLWNLGAA